MRNMRQRRPQTREERKNLIGDLRCGYSSRMTFVITMLGCGNTVKIRQKKLQSSGYRVDMSRLSEDC